MGKTKKSVAYYGKKEAVWDALEEKEKEKESDRLWQSQLKARQERVVAPAAPAVTTASSKGEATVGLASLVALFASTSKANSAEQRFTVTKADYSFEAQKGQSVMRAAFRVEVLVEEWVVVPLIPENVAVTSSSVKVTKAQEELASLSTSSSSASSSSLTTKSLSTPVACFAVLRKDEGQGQGLLVNRKGTYDIEIKGLIPYLNLRQTAIYLRTPIAVENNVVVRIPTPNLEVKVDPCLSLTTESAGAEHTQVRGRVSPTSTLTIQWTTKVVEIVEEQQKKEKLPLVVTAEQTTLHSIGEGLVSSSVEMKYVIQNESLSLVQISIDQRVRILNVSGLGIKKWDIIDPSKDNKSPVAQKDEVSSSSSSSSSSASPASPPSAGGEGRKILKVTLEYGLDDRYELLVSSEMDMGTTSGDVQIPVFFALGEGLKREKCQVAVEARTNVELQERSVDGAAVVDPSEVGGGLAERAAHPILLAYKVQGDPKNLGIKLAVKRHRDVDVLIAVVQKAHAVLTLTAEGRLLTKLLAHVRNTQKQFLRVGVAPNSEVWSTIVDGKPVKPAKDKDGRVMIPLQKSKTDFVVEFVYAQQPQQGPPSRAPGASPGELRSSGRLSFLIPQIDVPINHLFVSLYLPEDFKYGEFSGDLREIDYFSATPPGTYVPASHGGRALGRIHQAMAESRRNNKDRAVEQRKRDYDEAESDYGGAMYDEMVNPAELERMDSTDHFEVMKVADLKSPVRSNARVGVLPVQVEVPELGKQFRFEQLVVTGHSELHLHVDYKKVATKGCLSRRRVDGCTML